MTVLTNSTVSALRSAPVRTAVNRRVPPAPPRIPVESAPAPPAVGTAPLRIATVTVTSARAAPYAGLGSRLIASTTCCAVVTPLSMRTVSRLATGSQVACSLPAATPPTYWMASPLNAAPLRLAVTRTVVPATTSRSPTKAASNAPAVTCVSAAGAGIVLTAAPGPPSVATNGRWSVMAAATCPGMVRPSSMTTLSTRVAGS